jgi:hypothetical protein
MNGGYGACWNAGSYRIGELADTFSSNEASWNSSSTNCPASLRDKLASMPKKKRPHRADPGAACRKDNAMVNFATGKVLSERELWQRGLLP